MRRFCMIYSGLNLNQDKAMKPQTVQIETFAKFLFPDSRNLIKDFRLFLFQISTDSTQIPPLNPPWIPDNQASGPPFRRQQAHLAC